MIFILLNILISITLISVWYNPNGNFTYLQYFTLFSVFLGNFFFLNTLSLHEHSLSIFLVSLCLSSNSLLFSLANPLGPVAKGEKSAFRIHDESNSISKKEKELILPFCNYDFSKVNLNPKLISKYYELQNNKRNFFENLTFTFLKEYFYFKSLKSFYLVWKEGVKI